MKPIFKLTIFFFLLASTTFMACHKEKSGTLNSNPPPPQPPPPPPPPMGKTIQARVVEYNSGNPIAGAAIGLRPNYPRVNALNLNSDANGEFAFVTSTNKYDGISVTKPGYWDIALPSSDLVSPVIFYPAPINFNLATSYYYEGDSFVVKLFPKYNVTIHLKDSSRLLNDNLCSISFTCQGLFNLSGVDYSAYHGDLITLHPSIDTV